MLGSNSVIVMEAAIDGIPGTTQLSPLVELMCLGTELMGSTLMLGRVLEPDLPDYSERTLVSFPDITKEINIHCVEVRLCSSLQQCPTTL
ncbi:hypothetical protein AFLA70_500g000673 [Aspergillus flavus AF70]|nr:hypothetical protein AFLA70_500g000673 [Aspergillus flavus AF70]